jgi:hypothetical protein
MEMYSCFASDIFELHVKRISYLRTPAKYFRLRLLHDWLRYQIPSY